jgi:cystathionine gamma-synthase
MNKSSSNRTLETIAIHAGRSIDKGSGAVMPPIVLSTTFERAHDGSYTEGFAYRREGTPNCRSLEECCAELEQATNGGAVAFASGLSATMSIFNALQTGDHIIAPLDMYFGASAMLQEIYLRWGLQITFVDMTDLAAVQAAVRPNTKLIWIETPSNPMLTVVDIRAVVEIARKAGAITACDNTWATPLLQRPLELGCDVVMHSTTKYMGGHSDILGGVAICRERGELFERIQTFQHLGGAVPSPFDCWLLLRSIATLPQRINAHCANTQAVAEFLAAHPKVERVHYPGLADNPFHALAARQMKGFGGMLSFEVKAKSGSNGREEAFKVANALGLFTQATSLGGVESLVEHRASVEGAKTRAPESLLRLSIGLEGVSDLINDLSQALNTLG